MNKHLLIADDNEQFSAVVANVASRRGWLCSIYRNGRDLLSGLREMDGPTLLFLDILMPDLDGIETIVKLKSSAVAQGLRVRFVTGGVQTNAEAARMIADALRFDVGETIYKPVTIQELDTILGEESNIMDHRQSQAD
ncbi:MAG: response regulator [bacterium]